MCERGRLWGLCTLRSKGITTPSVKQSVKWCVRQCVKRQRQCHQCKSMVTLHLTLQMGPRSIA